MTERYEEYAPGRRPTAWDDALNQECPRCHQPVDVRCINPETGKVSHAPCIVRLKLVSA